MRVFVGERMPRFAQIRCCRRGRRRSKGSHIAECKEAGETGEDHQGRPGGGGHRDQGGEGVRRFFGPAGEGVEDDGCGGADGDGDQGGNEFAEAEPVALAGHGGEADQNTKAGEEEGSDNGKAGPPSVGISLIEDRLGSAIPAAGLGRVERLTAVTAGRGHGG